MIWYTVIVSIVAFVSTISYIVYRRQIKKICRQISFRIKHGGNILVTSELSKKEILELTDGINELIDFSRQIEKKYKTYDMNLKEAITNISHDIRTPLTSLDGYFQLMLEASSQEEETRYMTIIENRIGSLKIMLEELFTYTKLIDEEFVLECEEINFTKRVFDVAFSFYEDFKTKGIEPIIDIIEEKIIINANAVAIDRILQNVIKNALMHIDMDNPCITVAVTKKEDAVIFSCSNSVKNVESIDINKIFDRFYKSNQARTNISTGLGLAIAKGFVEKMDGNIFGRLENNNFVVQIEFMHILEYINF